MQSIIDQSIVVCGVLRLIILMIGNIGIRICSSVSSGHDDFKKFRYYNSS